MEITREMISFIEKQSWEEDLKQTVYLKILEATPVPVHHGWIVSLYRNAWLDDMRKSTRQKEILEENVGAVAENLGMRDTTSDPYDVLEAAEELHSRAESLSPLYAYTMVRLFFDGLTPEELAAEEGVDRNAIDQRVHNIKKALKGEQ